MTQANGVLLTVILASLVGVWADQTWQYKAPDECLWTGELETGVTLICKLQTINSELENTNFSVIQPRHTARLVLACNEDLFHQSSLTAASFRSLVELRELTIDFCKINSLSNEAFRGLGELRHLAVRTHNTDWDGMALEIGPRAFGEELGQLERLDLSFNNIKILPKAAFCALGNLEFLNLTRNRLQVVTNFGCTQKLEVLDLSHNLVESLPQSAFAGLSRLHLLDLSHNKIAFTSNQAFKALSSLKTLKLDNNNLNTLPPELFKDSRGVREIDLHNNSLAVLLPGLFSGLDQLLVLDLSSNKLSPEWVNPTTFAGLKQLTVLDLSSNRISQLDAAIFQDLKSLKILNLRHNAIETLADNTFHALTNLRTLVMSDNELTTVGAASLDGLARLSLLSLDNNKIINLHPNSLRNLTSLQDCYLNGNIFQHVPEALKSTPSIQTLDLGENLIENVSLTSFDKMPNLSGLRLIDNRINELRKGIFDGMKNLTIVNLSSNRIRYIEPGTFDENYNLQAIRLDNNWLTSVSGLFEKLTNLIWLNVSCNKLKSFDYSMIPPRLKWLDIHTNNITELGNHDEVGEPLVLNYLDVSINRLTEITGNSIPASIEVLFLNDNLISRVENYAFFQKPNLTRVDLKGNRISRIEPYSFQIAAVPPEKSLPEFYIGDNDYVCDCTMEWLQHVNDHNHTRSQPHIVDLESIYCELLHSKQRVYVPLTEATHSQFVCKYDTHCFALCHCCEFDACDCEMTCPANCTCYHDQTWSSNVVDCTSNGYSGTLPRQIPMDVTRLYVDGNDLQIVPSHAFIGRKKLKVLFLNASRIETLQNRSFNGLINLEDLYLQDNRLKILLGFEFVGLENLRLLRIDRNLISVLAKEAFANLRSLTSLDLRNNQLTSLEIKQLPRNVRVNMSRNPWSCDCEYVKQFREWIVDTYVTIIDAEDLACSTNTSELGFSIVTGKGLKFNTSICSELEGLEKGVAGNFMKKVVARKAIKDYLVLFVTGLLLTFAALFLACMCFFHRMKLQVWCYSHFNMRIFRREPNGEKNHCDKLFDIFISYSLRDEVFVLEKLVPVLEMGNLPYKMCLHHRDLSDGRFVSDSILRAAESSKCTVLILSDNFIEYEWRRSDLKSVYQQILRNKHRKPIIVFVGRIKQLKLDPDIRLHLKANNYLHWDDKFFWDKFKFALPDVSTYRLRPLPTIQLSSFEQLR